jgi:hypothetical protein
MSKHEIDIMWQKAMCQSIEDGEMFTRYHFAKLVAERALADSMQEVQRLGQEIEQEPDRTGMVYYKNDACKAKDAYADDCICWTKAQPPQRTEQEPVELPCCGYTDASAVKWNPFNRIVQCHNCGQTYTPPQENT